DVRQVVGEEIGDPPLFESGAGNTDGRLLEGENLLVGDPRQNAVREVSRHRRLRSPQRLNGAPASRGATIASAPSTGKPSSARRPGARLVSMGARRVPDRSTPTA